MGDEAFPMKAYLLKQYPGSQSKRDIEKTSSITFPDPGEVENASGIFSKKSKIYRRIPQSLAEDAYIIFATYFAVT
jgi:hypothetical protein